MAFFEFPHTRTYDSDLGWIIKRINEQQQQMDQQADYMADLKAWMDANEPRIDHIEEIYDLFMQGQLPDEVIEALDNWLNEYGVLAQAKAYTDTEISSIRALLTTEEGERIAEDALINARIDNLIVPSGSAPTEAEIIDARVGANGTTYNTLGEAIRDQIGDAETEIEELAEGNITFLSLANNGKILDNTLTLQNNGSMSVTDYVPIPENANEIKVSTKTYYNGAQHTILPQVFYFDENYTYLSRDSDQVNQYGRFTIPTGAKYVRVNQPSDSVTQVPKLIQFISNGFVQRKTLTDADDMNAITKPGLYFFDLASKPANLPSDYPANTSGRVLIAKSISDTNHSAEWQMVIAQNSIYYRTYYDNVWNAWNRTVDGNSALVYRNSLGPSDNIADVALPGIYFYNSPNTPLDAPTNAVSRPIVVKSGTETNFSADGQLVISNGGLFFRDREGASGSFTDWKSVGVDSPIYQTEDLPYNAVLYHQKWNSLLDPREMRRVNLGNVDADSTLPMYAYEYAPKRDFVGLTPDGKDSRPVFFDWTNALYPRPKILIIGGVHGNEKCTPMDIYRIAKLLKTQEYNEIACRFDWYFIPLVNPWGYSHARLDSEGNVIYGNVGETAQIVPCSSTINAGVRENSHGQNINRDWSDVVFTSGGISYGFQTPELQLIKNYVLGIAPDFFIDAHQNHNTLGIINGGAPVNPTGDAEYKKLMNKIYTTIDLANGDYDLIMKKYKSFTEGNNGQYARIWPTIRATTSDHYFAGVTVTEGGVTVGNTQHQSIATPYAICTETSEINYNFSGTYTWYNKTACIASCTYLWRVITRMAEFFK